MKRTHCLDCGIKHSREVTSIRKEAGCYYSYCKACMRLRGRADHAGITVARLKEMESTQSGVCAICQQATATHTDHDHKTGQIRELLCNACNVALAFVENNWRRFKIGDEKFLAYLEKHNSLTE